MRKQFIIVVFVLLISILSVSAITNDSIVFWYTLDTDSITGGRILDSTANNIDGDEEIQDSSDDYDGLASNTSESVNFNGNDDRFELDDNALFDIGSNDFSISFWVQSNYSGNTEMVLFQKDNANGDYIQIYVSSADGGRVNFYLSESGSGDACIWWFDDGEFTDDTPHFYVFQRNGTTCDGTNYHVFRDGSGTKESLTFHATSNKVITLFTPDEDFFIGTDNGGNSDFTGILDNIVYFDRWLNDTDIDELYNGGDGVSYPFVGGGGGSSPTLSLNHNLANTININTDQLFTYNGTYSDTTDLFNCSLIINDVLNLSDNDVNLSILQNFSWVIGVAEGNYSINISCENKDVSGSTGDYYYAIDPILPTIRIVSGLVNNSQLIQDNTLVVVVNVSDTNLYGYNISIFDSVGTELENYFAGNLVLTSYENTSSRVLSSLGNFSYRVQVWDSHSKIRIPDYNWYKVSYVVNNVTYKGISFNNNKFRMVTDDYANIDQFYLFKRVDRYLMAFKLNSLDYVTLFIESDYPVAYIDHRGYQGHLVIKNHWIDFESDDVEDFSISYISSKDVYRIRFKPLKDIVIFNSIGDLNFVEESYYYEVVSQDTVYLSSINSVLTDILEVIEMIPFMMLYIFLVVYGYNLISSGNLLIGYLYNITSLFFDFYLVSWLYTTYIQGNVVSGWVTSFIGLLSLGLIGLIFTKFAMLFYGRVAKQQKII